MRYFESGLARFFYGLSIALLVVAIAIVPSRAFADYGTDCKSSDACKTLSGSELGICLVPCCLDVSRCGSDSSCAVNCCQSGCGSDTDCYNACIAALPCFEGDTCEVGMNCKWFYPNCKSSTQGCNKYSGCEPCTCQDQADKTCACR